MEVDKILGATWKIKIVSISFYIVLALFIAWFIKINVDGFNQSPLPLTPEQQQRQWEDYYDHKHGPRG